jgi:hypothetical protein
MTICSFPPFRYQSVPQPMNEEGASSNRINEQSLEDYIRRMLQQLCNDAQEINSRLDSIEVRLDNLESQ